MCKFSNEIIGITRNDTTRDLFCTSWSKWFQISEDTSHLFGLHDDCSEEDFATGKDGPPSKMKQDSDAVPKFEAEFHRFKVFTTFNLEKTCNAVTRLRSQRKNDIATQEVTADFLTAKGKGECKGVIGRGDCAFLRSPEMPEAKDVCNPVQNTCARSKAEGHQNNQSEQVTHTETVSCVTSWANRRSLQSTGA